jgi:hypothetical protein
MPPLTVVVTPSYINGNAVSIVSAASTPWAPNVPVGTGHGESTRTRSVVTNYLFNR